MHSIKIPYNTEQRSTNAKCGRGRTNTKNKQNGKQTDHFRLLFWIIIFNICKLILSNYLYCAKKNFEIILKFMMFLFSCLMEFSVLFSLFYFRFSLYLDLGRVLHLLFLFLLGSIQLWYSWHVYRLDNSNYTKVKAGYKLYFIWLKMNFWNWF